MCFFSAFILKQPQIIVKIFNIDQSDILAIQFNQGEAFV